MIYDIYEKNLVRSHSQKSMLLTMAITINKTMNEHLIFDDQFASYININHIHIPT